MLWSVWSQTPSCKKDVLYMNVAGHFRARECMFSHLLGRESRSFLEAKIVFLTWCMPKNQSLLVIVFHWHLYNHWRNKCTRLQKTVHTFLCDAYFARAYASYYSRSKRVGRGGHPLCILTLSSLNVHVKLWLHFRIKSFVHMSYRHANNLDLKLYWECFTFELQYF